MLQLLILLAQAVGALFGDVLQHAGGLGHLLGVAGELAQGGALALLHVGKVGEQLANLIAAGDLYGHAQVVLGKTLMSTTLCRSLGGGWTAIGVCPAGLEGWNSLVFDYRPQFASASLMLTPIGPRLYPHGLAEGPSESRNGLIAHGGTHLFDRIVGFEQLAGMAHAQGK